MGLNQQSWSQDGGQNDNNDNSQGDSGERGNQGYNQDGYNQDGYNQGYDDQQYNDDRLADDVASAIQQDRYVPQQRRTIQGVEGLPVIPKDRIKTLSRNKGRQEGQPIAWIPHGKGSYFFVVYKAGMP